MIELDTGPVIILRCEKKQGKTLILFFLHNQISKSHYAGRGLEQSGPRSCIAGMDRHTTTTTRNDIALVRFGGRVWELVGISYSTVTIRDRKNDIRVHRDRVVPVNERATEMLTDGNQNKPPV